MKKFLFIIIFIGSFLHVIAQQTKLLTADRHNEYGLVYTLPVTSFQFEISAIKETKIAGPFYKYSKIFTSEAEVITKDEIKWNIESIKVTPYGIPDMQNKYLMQLKAGSATFIAVADDGMLLAINKETSLSKMPSISADEIEGVKTTGKEYLDYVNEDFLSAQSSYKQAQLLAEEIMEIRDSKISLTRGTAETMPTDGRQLEIMLESLEKQESALTNAFKGSSWKERIVRTFTLTPDNEGQYVICRLSPTKGLLESGDALGEPVVVSIDKIEEAELPLDSKGEEKKLPKDAVVYCIPGIANLSVSIGEQELFQETFPMSQFGMLFGLSPSIFTDKKEPGYAIFDSSTGALKELGTLK